MSGTNKRKTQSAKIFHQLSDFYFVVFGRSLEHGRSCVGEWLYKEKPAKILEVGVGTGLTFRHYPAGTQLHGIDISPYMIEKATDRAREFKELEIKLDVMDATKLPFEADSFDFVYAPSVLSVVHDAEAVFKEMLRVCKPGGHVFAICYARGNGTLDRVTAKILGPLSERFLGFHMRLEQSFFEKFTSLEYLGREDVNFVGPWPLSTLFKFKKKI